MERPNEHLPHSGAEPESELAQAPDRAEEPAGAEDGAGPAAATQPAQAATPFRVTRRTVFNTAVFKRLPVKTIAAAVGLPEAVLDEYLRGGRIKLPEKKVRQVVETVGIDLTGLNLSSDRVHFFRLDAFTGAFGVSDRRKFVEAMDAMGALLRDSKAARVVFPTIGFRRRLGMLPAVHVVQNDRFRALFIGARGVRFDVAHIPGCQWVVDSERDSVVEVMQDDLARRILVADLMPSEFDDIFRSDRVMTWNQVIGTARAHGVTKEDLVRWIVSGGPEGRRAAVTEAGEQQMQGGGQRVLAATGTNDASASAWAGDDARQRKTGLRLVAINSWRSRAESRQDTDGEQRQAASGIAQGARMQGPEDDHPEFDAPVVDDTPDAEIVANDGGANPQAGWH